MPFRDRFEKMRPKKYIKFHHYFIDFNRTKPQHTSNPPSEGRLYDGLSEFTELTAAGGSAYLHHDGFVGLCSPYT